MHVAHDRPSGCYKWTSPNAVLTITGAHLPINIHNTTLELIAKPHHLLRLFLIKPAR
jgi:hypothetical protein